MSGWDFLEGKNKRIGARVIENAELRGLRHLGLETWCAASANERPPKADTDVQTHAPALESWSVHAVPAAPECPFIGRDDPAANNVQICAPKPPHSQLGQPPGRRVSRGAPEVRALSAALGVATRDLALVGVVVPNKDRLEHLRLYLRAHCEV